MKKRSVSWASLVCGMAVAAAVWAVPSPTRAVAIPPADVPKTSQAPVIDGKKDSLWSKVPEYPMQNYVVAVHDNANLDPKKSPDDFSGKWKAMWDDKYFYLLLEITDPIRIGYAAESGRREIHYDDSVQLFLAPNLQTPYTSTLWNIKSKQMVGWYGPPGWAQLDLSPIKYAVNDYGQGYIIETAVPWSSVKATPKAGQSLLFDIQAVDNDLGPDKYSKNGVSGRYPQSKLTWFDPQNIAWQGNQYLGTIVLKDSASSAPSPTRTPGAATSTPSGPTSTPAPTSGSGIKLIINGADRTADAAPVIVDNTTLVPMRMIFETFGATVNWDAATKTITAVKGNTTIVLRIGSKTAKKNNQDLALTVAPQLIDGRTMVPLRFVSESLGARVDWNAATKTVTINSP